MTITILIKIKILNIINIMINLMPCISYFEYLFRMLLNENTCIISLMFNDELIANKLIN